jgi:hypothetical protein
MSFCIIGDLIAHARSKMKRAPVSQLRVELPGKAKKNVALAAPMIGSIAR